MNYGEFRIIKIKEKNYMTKNIFVIADMHFSHKKLCTPDENGDTYRPFKSIEEMDEALIYNWNHVVGDNDMVYVLGDVCINRSGLKNISRLTGNKILVKGNHDNFRLSEYSEYFKDIMGSLTIEDYILTHIPVHTCQKERFKGNIHGHLHDKKVMQNVFCYDDGIDDWYTCVSAEQINYTPINIEEIIKLIITDEKN